MVSENTKNLIEKIGYDFRTKQILLSDIPENEKLVLLEAEKCYRLWNLTVQTRPAEEQY